LDLVTILNIMAFAALFLVGIVPLYIAVTVKVRSLRILSSLLGIFAITHGLYHLFGALSQSFLAEVIFEPISIVFLVSFGLYYSKKGVA
jgi:hypothetical protein